MPEVVGYTTLDDDSQYFYNKVLLVRARPNLVHDRFGQQKPLPTKSTRKQTFRRYNALTPTTTPLLEGVPPTGSQITKTDVTVTVKQYGDFVTVSDIVTFFSRDPVLTEIAEVLGEQAGDSLDQVFRDVLVAGTNVFYAADDSGGTGAGRVNVAGAFNDTFARKLIRKLQNENAKKFTRIIMGQDKVGTTPIRAAYWGITHPDVNYDLDNTTLNPKFVPTAEYPSSQQVMMEEVGAIREIRFVTSTQAKIVADAGAAVGATGLKSTGASNIDVYITLLFGTNAYGIVPLSGHSMENIVKPLGSAGTADPLNQRATSGWKAITTAVILNDAFMLRAETGAKA